MVDDEGNRILVNHMDNVFMNNQCGLTGLCHDPVNGVLPAQAFLFSKLTYVLQLACRTGEWE